MLGFGRLVTGERPRRPIRVLYLASPERRTTTPRATLARLVSAVLPALTGIGRERFGELYKEVIYLPELDISLHLRLRGVLAPEIESALCTCSVHDEKASTRRSERHCPPSTRLRTASGLPKQYWRFATGARASSARGLGGDRLEPDGARLLALSLRPVDRCQIGR